MKEADQIIEHIAAIKQICDGFQTKTKAREVCVNLDRYYQSVRGGKAASFDGLEIIAAVSNQIHVDFDLDKE